METGCCTHERTHNHSYCGEFDYLPWPNRVRETCLQLSGLALQLQDGKWA